MVEDVHHLELVHHPGVALAGAAHHLRREVAAGEAVGDHDGVDGGRVLLDAAVQPPIPGHIREENGSHTVTPDLNCQLGSMSSYNDGVVKGGKIQIG